METLGFILVFYLVASFLITLATIYRNYDYFVKLSQKKTDESNEELDEQMERGEVTPMERDAKLESYSEGFVIFFIVQLLRGPLDAPIYLFAMLLDIGWNEDDPREPEKE